VRMVDYEIGYGKPPKHSQFKKGVCANPRGRPRRRDTQIGEVVRDFLSGIVRKGEPKRRQDWNWRSNGMSPRR
jgi:hypothetical protein